MSTTARTATSVNRRRQKSIAVGERVCFTEKSFLRLSDRRQIITNDGSKVYFRAFDEARVLRVEGAWLEVQGAAYYGSRIVLLRNDAIGWIKAAWVTEQLYKGPDLAFPLAEPPLNAEGKLYDDSFRFYAPVGTNQTTFSSPRNGGARRHAARDLYTPAKTPVFAMASGEILSIKPFYFQTDQVTIRHDFMLDGQHSCVIRYGELDPDSLLGLTVGQRVKRGQQLGATGLMLRENGEPFISVDGKPVYMLHLEAYSGALSGKLTTTQGTNGFLRRADLIDPLPLLREAFTAQFRRPLDPPLPAVQPPAATNPMATTLPFGPIRIDIALIDALESGPKPHVGQVPDPDRSQSGVTVGIGFDLGQIERSYLVLIGLESRLIDILEPYLGLKRQVAVQKLRELPLILSKTDLAAINEAVISEKSSEIERQYDAGSSVRFRQLPRQAQTVIFSVGHQYGSLKRRTPSFFKKVIAQDWSGTVAELRNFGDLYTRRRNIEADTLERLLHLIEINQRLAVTFRWDRHIPLIVTKLGLPEQGGMSAIDGFFVEALTVYQEVNRLGADGLLGAQTLRKMGLG